MEIRCKIEIVLVRDLIDDNGNIVPATDIIESVDQIFIAILANSCFLLY